MHTDIRLLEDVMDAGRFGQAALLSACVGICRAYALERVVVVNVRMQLRQLSAADDELDLFAALLLRHVRQPEDRELYLAAKAAWERITGSAGAAPPSRLRGSEGPA